MMKNFLFPQIFQPVLQENTLNISARWQMTSRRIQTQMEITNPNPNHKTHKFLKSSPYHLLLRPQKSYVTEKDQQKQKEFEQISWTVNEKSSDKTQVHFQIPDQTFDLGNTSRQPPAPAFRSKKQKKTNVSVQISQQARLQRTRNQSRVNKQNERVPKGLKKGNQKSQLEKGQAIKNNGQYAGKKKLKQATKVKFDVESKSNKKAEQEDKTPDNNVNRPDLNGLSQIQHTNQNSQQKSADQKKHSREKRRFGVENPSKIDIDFQATSNINKILINNQKLLQHQTRKRVAENVNLGPRANVYETRGSDEKVRRSKTFHLIQNQRVNRQMKRTYTIWDITDQSSQQQEKPEVVEKNEGQQIEKNFEDKKKKAKKVRFNRTSIEQKTKTSKNISFKQIESTRKMILKGIPKRSWKNDESSSQIDLPDKKLKQLPLKLKKKASITRKKHEGENVYNELNYIRMRLNATERQHMVTESNSCNPQPISVNVEKVSYQLENQRKDRTKFSNMMIDFGVRLTRDFLLKQVGVKEKVMNYPV